MARVKQETIDEIKSLGMAKALQKAASGQASEEFKEGIRRYYPNAKFGPKMKAAAAEVQSAPSPEAKGSSKDAEVTRVMKKTSPHSKPAAAAIARRQADNRTNPNMPNSHLTNAVPRWAKAAGRAVKKTGISNVDNSRTDRIRRTNPDHLINKIPKMFKETEEDKKKRKESNSGRVSAYRKATGR